MLRAIVLVVCLAGCATPSQIQEGGLEVPDVNPCTGLPDLVSGNVPKLPFFQLSAKAQGTQLIAWLELDLRYEYEGEHGHVWQGPDGELRVQPELISWTHPTTWPDGEAKVRELLQTLGAEGVQRNGYVQDSDTFQRQQWDQVDPVFVPQVVDLYVHKANYNQVGWHSSFTLSTMYQDLDPVPALTYQQATDQAQAVQACFEAAGEPNATLQTAPGAAQHVMAQSLAYHVSYLIPDPDHHCGGTAFSIVIDAVTGGYLGKSQFLCD